MTVTVDSPDTAGPRAAVDELAGSARPFLLGVRHHSPALAAVVPALLDAADPDVLCVELPADFQQWLPYLADPGTVAPIALAGAGRDGRLGFYPFADFSPELAAVRWAREHGVQVLCCDLPLSDPGWSAVPAPARPADPGEDPKAVPAPVFADALAASGTGREGDDLWDRAVEVLAPGCTPEAVRRAALGVGWALRKDAEAGGGVPPTDLAREAYMREVLGRAASGGRRVAAVIGAFHAPALLDLPAMADDADTSGPTASHAPDPANSSAPDPNTTQDPSSASEPRAASDPSAASGSNVVVGPDGVPGPVSAVKRKPVSQSPSGSAPDSQAAPVTSLVPYAFDLLDERSGYPAGIRDPRWQQAVLGAGGDPGRVREAAARAITDICRELRAAGHTAGTGEAAETLRLACDLARLRALPAPGRGELIEAVTTVLGQGEPLGRGRAVAKALEKVLVGAERGRVAAHTPRSGLGPSVEEELAALRLPCPQKPEAREVRLDPLRSDLDRRREVLLQRLMVCGIGYGEPIEVSGTGDGTALTTRWRLSWTPAVPARLDLAGVRGVTAEQAAAGTLAETFRRESADGGATCAQILAGLRAAARCDLPDLVADRLADATEVLPAAGTLPELLEGLDLLEALRRRHLPGTTAGTRERAAELAVILLEAAVRSLPGLAGSDRPEDAAALVDLAARAGEHHLGLRLDDALGTLAATGSPMMRGVALAVRVLLDLDGSGALGARVTGWIDTATDPEGRRRLSRQLAGLLTAAGPLLQSAPAALDPLIDRIDGLSDRAFLDRLPALRGGFDALAPAARSRLLDTVTERVGDRLDLDLDVPPELLALWTSADTAGMAALDALHLPTPDTNQSPTPAPETTLSTVPEAPPSADTSGSPASGKAPEAGPASAGDRRPASETAAGPGVAALAKQDAALAGGRSLVSETTSEPGGVAVANQSATPEAASAGNGGLDSAAGAEPGPAGGSGPAAALRLAPADRWRLLLGRETERLPGGARRYAQALDELYGAGRGEGAADFGPGAEAGDGSAGGQGASFPTAREWAKELEALFGTEVREEVLAQAADVGRTDVLSELNPDAVRPSVELLTSVLSLAGGMPEHQLARLRPLVRRLVDELAKELATRMRPALTGLATPRPTRRPGGRLDLPRTLRANLAHTRRLGDGRTVVVPERPVFSTRSRKESDWRLILVVDVSGSMEASVVWSALTAAVLGGVPTLSTHFLAFSTDVIDLTDRVADPLSLLLEVRVGGGTHIAAGLAHARSLITVPSRTLVVVVSDFEEGYPLGGLLGEVRALTSSGVHLLGCAALDDTGTPRYCEPVARQLAAAGMPVAALSPLALARWVGDRLRGEHR